MKVLPRGGGARDERVAGRWCFPRSAWLGALATLLSAWRGLWPRSQPDTVIVVGTDATIAAVAGMLDTHWHWRMLFGVRPKPKQVLRLASIDLARDRIGDIHCDEVVVSNLDDCKGLRLIDARGRPATFVSRNTVVARQLERIPLELVANEPWATSDSAPTLRAGAYGVAKRMLDIVLGFGVGLLALPLMPLVALAIWLETGRPILMSVERVGQFGRPFRMRQFRTAGNPLKDGQSDGALSSPRAPTRVGHLLRMTHLANVPALWNVLNGDLSLIGPRPEGIVEAKAYQQDYPQFSRRHIAKPGLASWAQARLRSSHSPRDARLALEYDLYYAKHASLAFDLNFLARATWMVLADVIKVTVTLCGRAQSKLLLAGAGDDGELLDERAAGLRVGLARRITLKRLIDLSGALVGCVALFPLLAIVMLMVYISMGRPVIFTQDRTGLHNNPFKVYKFRTMREAWDTNGEPLSDRERLTAVGRFLRKVSADELPQLWNVVKGDMSLVGPRPLPAEFLPRYNMEQARRHEVLPGITGWAQINGRNGISWEEKFAFDVWYVDNRSPWLDVRILVKTVGTIFGCDGISAPGEATMPRFLGTVEHRSPAAAETVATMSTAYASGRSTTFASRDFALEDDRGALEDRRQRLNPQPVIAD